MHRPTFQNAIGGSTQGARRVHAPKRGVSVKDVLGNTEVKRRVVPAAGDTGDLKRRLEAREEEAAHKRGKPLPRSEPEPDKALEWLRAHNPDTLVKPESSAESDESSSEESDSDEEELLRELEKIKREREEEAVMRQRAAEEEERMEQRSVSANSNPLMADQKVQKKWWEDTVFRGQAKQDSKQKKTFVNDTVRSDFHRKFIDRFVK